MNRLDDPAFVEEWFRRHATDLGETDPRVTEVRRLARGVSRQTWQVRLGTRRAFAVRRDHPAGSIIPTTLRTEYEVYRRLGPTPVPTADALWFEETRGGSPTGGPPTSVRWSRAAGGCPSSRAATPPTTPR